MTNAKREEIIATMSSLLEQLVDSDTPKAALLRYFVGAK